LLFDPAMSSAGPASQRFMSNVTVLTEGLAMGESARWHDGRFWCSDWMVGEVLAISVNGADAGQREVVTRSTSFPFCFDWTSDNTMLVTSRTGLDRLDAGGSLQAHADLSSISDYGWNEVVVHPSGAAYVNGINFDMMGADGMNFEVGSKSGVIAVVTPDGQRRIVAGTVAFPNGMAVSADGGTLLVAESFASRVSAFDIQDDHGLGNRRVWAVIDGGVDGISLDAEGALWCAAPSGALRIAAGGRVLQRIELDRPAFSVALGGPNATTLFMVANEWNGVEQIGRGPRTGIVYMTEVDVPAA
jgi:sugar lactone lactonase YvrE